MADDEKKERRESASSHSSDSSIENDDKKSTSSEGDHEIEKHSTSSEHDDHSTTDPEHDETDKHSTSSEHDGDDHVSEKDSLGEDPEKPIDESPSNSHRTSHSSKSSIHSENPLSGDDHSHTTDDNHSHSSNQNPSTPVYLNVNQDGLPPEDEPKDGSIDSFSMNHVYANAAFTMEPRPDYQDTSGAESPSIRRESVSTATDYEHPIPPPSDLGFYTIPLQGTETERPPSSSTVVVMPDEESGCPWLTYLCGAAVFSIIFIIILIIYFSVSFA